MGQCVVALAGFGLCLGAGYGSTVPFFTIGTELEKLGYSLLLLVWTIIGSARVVDGTILAHPHTCDRFSWLCWWLDSHHWIAILQGFFHRSWLPCHIWYAGCHLCVDGLVLSCAAMRILPRLINNEVHPFRPTLLGLKVPSFLPCGWHVVCSIALGQTWKPW